MNNLASLERLFNRLGVDYSTPGFYDDPSFIQAEKENPAFLENYADYVESKEYSSSYLKTAREAIHRAAHFLHQELKDDGRVGACADASMVLSRFLEKEGIWNYIVKGALRIDFAEETGIPSSYLQAIMSSWNPAVVGHAWVSAPPYRVVDITAEFQNHPRGGHEYLQGPMFGEKVMPTGYTIEDLVEADAALELSAKNGRPPTLSDIDDLYPGLMKRIKRFGCFAVPKGKTTFNYVAIAVSAPDLPLEKANNLILSGRNPAQLYEAFAGA